MTVDFSLETTEKEIAQHFSSTEIKDLSTRRTVPTETIIQGWKRNKISGEEKV